MQLTQRIYQLLSKPQALTVGELAASIKMTGKQSELIEHLGALQETGWVLETSCGRWIANEPSSSPALVSALIECTMVTNDLIKQLKRGLKLTSVVPAIGDANETG